MQISCSELESRRSGKGHFAAAPAHLAKAAIPGMLLINRVPMYDEPPACKGPSHRMYIS